MESDTDTQLTISKWPFYLGDVLLVGVAITIGSLSNWELTDLQVAYCVVAVALGSGLFVLPYIVEYSMRYRELAEDRDGQFRVFVRQLQQIEQASIVQAEQISELSNTKRAGTNSEPLLTAALEQLTKLQTAQASASDELTNLKQGLADLSKGNQSDADARAEKNKVTEEALSLAQQSIENLQSQLSDLAKRITSLQSHEEHLTKIEVNSGSSTNPSANSEAGVSNEAKAKKESELAIEPQSRLLKRAIVEKKDPDSSAVDRIIDSKVESEDSEAITVQNNREQTNSSAQPEVHSAEEEISDKTSEPDLSLDSAPEEKASVSAKKGSKKAKTVVLVHALIGIGNKPYIRGSGGGLNWEHGVMMDFQEIGKWRWEAPANLDSAIEVEIYFNDEDPDTQGKQSLEPGKNLEITPKF